MAVHIRLLPGIAAASIIVTGELSAEPALEPYAYHQDFETREECAWASYPIWQDTAFDPNFRPHEIVPGDPNISLEQKVTPYTHVDSYAGAQKKFDAWLVPGSTIRLRYYLKSHLPFESFTVRIAAGADGKIDFTIPHPKTNRWEWATVRFEDFILQNPKLAGKSRLKVNALAALAKAPGGDPAMPVYLGLDDVTLKGMRPAEFRFIKPAAYELAEWKPRIAKKHFHAGERFELEGAWPFQADAVKLTVLSFADRTNQFLAADLTKKGPFWAVTPFALTFPRGMYLAVLTAYRGGEPAAESRLTFIIAPENIGGKHPRLWFDNESKKQLLSRLKSERFRKVDESIASAAASSRKRVPPGSVRYAFDQLPDEDAMPTWDVWTGWYAQWGGAVYNNGLAWALHGDREAGMYAKDLLMKLASLPSWDSPWMLKRGRYNYLRNGEFHQNLGIGYDLVYDLMTPDESKTIRAALIRNSIKGAFRTYVENDMITCDTSNWLSHIIGGALICSAAVYGDGSEADTLEPWLSGALFKYYDFISATFTPGESYGEGMGYYNTAMRGLARSHPSLERVFNLDFTHFMDGSYQEVIWGGIISDKRYFHYGDSGNYPTLERWAWLLGKRREPLLGWFYNYMKRGDDFYDVLYETSDVPREEPYNREPVRVFRRTGTSVFKSGWGKDDFVFVLRSGPFINHQHLDQGSFWLADRGATFIEERHGSSYYDDVLYQSWYTQPAGHSTILIDGNRQSQRAGDPLVFAEGFEDYARTTHFLNGDFAAFVTGDIGHLYWGKVNGLERNVLYLKPRTLLMLDTAYPAERDADITMLYQTAFLKDIAAGGKRSTITKGDITLHILHLAPEYMKVASVETPHYLGVLRGEGPLEREGMLTVTARTNGAPLVAANLLTTTMGTGAPDATCETGDGFVAGKASGIDFAFTTKPGFVYTAGGYSTDATAMTWKDGAVFAARCTRLARNGKTLVRAQAPVTCELSGGAVKYYHCKAGAVSFGAASKPSGVTVNGASTTGFIWNAENGLVTVNLPAGEGTVTFR